MSILNYKASLIEIKLYYKEIQKDGFTGVVVLKDDIAENLLKDEEKKKEVKVLNTKWKFLTWGDQNKITKQSERFTPDGIQDIDWFRYRDLRIKSCLQDWDVTDDKGNKIPVSSEIIDMLPPEIIVSLLDKYDNITRIDEIKESKN
jgi:hypothetical protein